MGASGSKFREQVIMVTEDEYLRDKNFFDRMKYTYMILVVPNGATEVTTEDRVFGWEGEVIATYKLGGKKIRHEYSLCKGVFSTF